ncbi:hypothetical protein PPERSA_09660 [Pseudocohnilembus persalinus]|uniref:Alpha/beta hydrolase fold-3 domain-containing protein n=1 Tax=Pseudocohnilembus persalinus TaxID=266149 RepID=A0A0V0R6Z9_PSEPJ|nr:hypothetical protein PPERSA_09660 [Pseudocohnilembus persalinus]|eukprot:KRX10276.1 hypothetical protein PPERSA_09660 [Pseudocohnilembus persalinus]
MSSRTHQTYTRKWAKNLKTPIFCIDYRKAPAHPYPQALDDCWQGYNWIISNCHLFFNINPKKIILVGDSAGGNLIAALTSLIIQKQVRYPDAVILAYPALNLNLKRFTPSHLIAIDDFILSHTILKLCVEAYLGVQNQKQNTIQEQQTKHNYTQDYFISPSIMPDKILQLFPQTHIFVGTEDPLHDDCIRFFQRLQQLGVQSSLTVYQNMPHGFLNFDFPQGMEESKICVNDICQLMEKIIKQ